MADKSPFFFETAQLADASSEQMATSGDLGVDRFASYLAGDRYMEAMVVAKKILKDRPTEPLLRTLVVRVYLAQSKYQQVAREIDDMLLASPSLDLALRSELQLGATELLDAHQLLGDSDRRRFALRRLEAALDRILPLPHPEPPRRA